MEREGLRPTRDVSSQELVEPKELLEVLRQIGRDLKGAPHPIQKKADGALYRKFHNVEMLRKLSGGLFDIYDPLGIY